MSINSKNFDTEKIDVIFKFKDNDKICFAKMTKTQYENLKDVENIERCEIVENSEKKMTNLRLTACRLAGIQNECGPILEKGTPIESFVKFS